MITIFTIPKKFVGHTGIIQTNAINSWRKLDPLCEIILCGDDEGTSQIASQSDLLHLQTVETNEYGTPLLSSAFSMVQSVAKYNKIMYINADIILFQDAIDTLKMINLKHYVLSGRRWDIDIDDAIDYSDMNWMSKLKYNVTKSGQLHGYSGKDYFVFPRGLVDMPPFAVGRPGWDDWFLFHMRSKRIPIIDGTASLTAIHQNHDYSHSKYGTKSRVSGPEYASNTSLIGSFTNIIDLRDADLVTTLTSIEKPAYPNRLFNILSHIFLWRLALAIKRRFNYFVSGIVDRYL